MKSASKFSAYTELTKPRILTLILVTTGLGFFLGSSEGVAWLRLAWTLFGTGLVCAGASTLNHYLERDADKKMLRTRNRPIPSGAVAPVSALNFGIILVLSGVFLLVWKVNLLTAFLSLLTAFLYVLVYTPIKKISWLNTSIGAIPGAIPPVGGWAAATGELSWEAWILFAILFAWQHPHFYAIAWIFREDYKRGGFKMLPVIEPDGRRMFRHINVFSLVLIPISILPVLAGMSGRVYLLGATVLGFLLLGASLSFAGSKTTVDARKLLKASVLYLPLLLLLIVVDGSF
jgi:protoheme IX farnesyltransferase